MCAAGPRVRIWGSSPTHHPEVQARQLQARAASSARSAHAEAAEAAEAAVAAVTEPTELRHQLAASEPAREAAVRRASAVPSAKPIPNDFGMLLPLLTGGSHV